MSDLTDELHGEIARLKSRVRALSKAHTELSTVSNKTISSLEHEIEQIYIEKNKADYQVRQFELERVDLKIAVKNLSLYLQVAVI